jgi:hypothetical protein
MFFFSSLVRGITKKLFFSCRKEVYGLHPAPYIFSRADFTASVLKNTTYGLPEAVAITGRCILLLTERKFLTNYFTIVYVINNTALWSSIGVRYFLIRFLYSLTL